MPTSDDALTWRTWLGFSVAAGVIAAVAAPVALWVGPGFRPMVWRGAGALLAIVVLPRMLRAVREAAGVDMETPVRRLLRDPPSIAQVDPAFARLASEIHGALVHRRHDEDHRIARSLWSRLGHIGVQRGLESARLDTLMAGRDRQALLRLIEAIEAAQ
jgi:hypothetical protein